MTNQPARLEDLTSDQRRLVVALIAAGSAQGKERDSAMVDIAEPETIVTPRAEVALVTPEMAGRWLAANVGNRHVRPTVVSRYARDMTAGFWELNGETIKIAAGGRVLDGQHRLHAVVESDTPVQMLVVSGLPESVQDTVDRGMPRNMADALRLRGEPSATLLAAAIAQSWMLKSLTPTDNKSWPSTREGLGYLDDHPAIRESLGKGELVRKSLRSPASTAAALHHLFAEIDADDADAFFAALVSGAGLSDDSPIFRLREVLIREMSATRRTDRKRLQALWIKAWNAWRRGQPVLLLKWKTGGANPEAFPRPE